MGRTTGRVCCRCLRAHRDCSRLLNPQEQSCDLMCPSDESDSTTVCCGCLQTHRDFSACFYASLRLEDPKFHCHMCNICVDTLTCESGSSPLRTFKTFSVPGVAGGGGQDGGAAARNRTDNGVEVDLGNGVTVAVTEIMKKVVTVEDGGGGGRATPTLDVWRARRAVFKAAAAVAPAVVAAATAAALAAATVAVVTGYALTHANVAEVGAWSVGEGAERSSERPRKLDDASGSDGGGGDDNNDNDSCNSSRTVCCGCLQTHRDFSPCFYASLRLEDPKFHWHMCNICVDTLTFEDGSDLPRTFKTFSVPGVAGGLGQDGGAAAGNRADKGVDVDLGNGVTVTAMKRVVMVEDDGGERATPSLDVWRARRAVFKAAAAVAPAVVAAATAAALAAATVAVTGYALTRANVAEVGAAAGAREGGAERLSGRPSKLDDASGCYGGGGDNNDSYNSNTNESSGCESSRSKRRSSKSSSSSINCSSSSSSSGSGKSSSGSQCRGPGSTAPNTPKDSIAFFSDGSSHSSDSRDTGSLTSASRTSSGIDMDIAAAAVAAAAAATAPPQASPPQQQQQRTGVTRSTSVLAMARALDRKIAGLDDAPTLTPTIAQESNTKSACDAPEQRVSAFGSREEGGSGQQSNTRSACEAPEQRVSSAFGSREEGGSEALVGGSISGISAGVVGKKLSGRAAVVAGGNEGLAQQLEGGRGGVGGADNGKDKVGGGGDGGGGGGDEEEEEAAEVEEVKTGGRRGRLFYCGVAAVGMGLVGAAVWAFGGRPSRR